MNEKIAETEEEFFSRMGVGVPVPEKDYAKPPAQVKMSDYSEAERMKIARSNLDRIMQTTVKGVPVMLTARDIMEIFYLPRRAAYRFIKRHLVPLGAVILVGNSYRIHPWGIARLLNQGKRCGYCGRGGPDIPGIPYYATGATKQLESLEQMKKQQREAPRGHMGQD